MTTIGSTVLLDTPSAHPPYCLNTPCICSGDNFWVCRMKTVVKAICSAPEHLQTFQALAYGHRIRSGYSPYEVCAHTLYFAHQMFGIWNATRASILPSASSQLVLVRYVTGYFCLSPPFALVWRNFDVRGKTDFWLPILIKALPPLHHQWFRLSRTDSHDLLCVQCTTQLD